MKYEELKSKVEQLRRKADKAEGALSELMKQLKKEFGCSTLKEAEKLLTKWEQQEQEQLTELEEKLEQFKQEYGDALED